MNIKISLLKKFFLFSFIVFFLIWLSLGLITNYQVEQYTLKKVETDVVDHIKSHARDHIPEEALQRSNYVKNKEIFDDFYHDINYLGISRIKIYDKSGFIIYSDVESLIGKAFDNHDLDEALDGKDVAEIEKANIDEQKTEKDLGIFIEAYIPIVYEDGGKPLGVIEVYITLTPVYESLEPFKKIIWLTTAVIMVLLFYVLYIIFRNASNIIVEKNRELEEKTNALKLSAEQDEAILESIDEALVMVNRAGQILTFNPKAEALTGYNSFDITFRHYRKVLEFRNKEGKRFEGDFLKSSLEKRLLIRKGPQEEIYLKNSKQALVPISLVTAPIYDQKMENIVGAIATFNDISKEKELEKVKDEFVYVIAHELSNPIFVVSSYLSLVTDGTMGKISTKVLDALNVAKDANQQLSNLVNDLLEVIRSQTGQMRFDLTPVEITDIAEEAIRGLKGRAKDKKIEIILDKKNAGKVLSNPQKIKEVFANLIDNAIKYSPNSSRVKVYFEKDGKNLKTYIEDNGYGMTKLEAVKLFDKFYRIKNEKTKSISGTGLGLFIVKQLVEKMGGKIDFQSEEGKGTIFGFTLKSK